MKSFVAYGTWLADEDDPASLPEFDDMVVEAESIDEALAIIRDQTDGQFRIDVLEDEETGQETRMD